MSNPQDNGNNHVTSNSTAGSDRNNTVMTHTSSTTAVGSVATAAPQGNAPQGNAPQGAVMSGYGGTTTHDHTAQSVGAGSAPSNAAGNAPQGVVMSSHVGTTTSSTTSFVGAGSAPSNAAGTNAVDSAASRNVASKIAAAIKASRTTMPPQADASTGALQICNPVINEIKARQIVPPVVTPAAPSPQESAVTSDSSSGLIKPSLAELSEILQYIDGTVRSNRKQVCLSMGATYKRDKQVRSLLINWLRTQLDNKLDASIFLFERGDSSPYRFDTLLRLAQAGGYQLPAKLQPWLSANDGKGSVSASSGQSNASPAEQAIADFEQQTKNELADLSVRILSYWLTASEDDKARYSFLSDNYERFRFFPKRYQPLASALFAYCKARQEDENPYLPFSLPDFTDWACNHDPQHITATLIENICRNKHSTTSAPLSSKHNIQSRVRINEEMELLYHKSWILNTFSAAQDLIQELRSTPEDYDKCRKARHDFISATHESEKERALGSSTIAADTEESIDTLIDPNKRINLWVPSGYKLIDEGYSGYQRGGITIFGASSGLGKTWLGVDTSFKVVDIFNGRALYMSTEMDVSSIALRFFGVATDCKIGVAELCAANKLGLIPQMKVAFRSIAQRHFSAGNAAGQQLHLHSPDNLFERLRIYGSETGLSLSKIVNLINEERTKGPLDLVVIDYLQNIENDQIEPGRPRYEQIKHIVNTLKEVAQNCNCAILILAQLTNPACWEVQQKGEPPVPTAKDIAECSYAIQPASTVFMMYKATSAGNWQNMGIPFDREDAGAGEAGTKGYNFDPKDEDIFSDATHPYKTALRLIVTKCRFNAVAPLNEPIFVERSNGSRFNFYL